VAWSRKFDCCTVCGSTSRKHYGHGLCQSCYPKQWASDRTDELRAYKHRWYERSKSRIDYREKCFKNKYGYERKQLFKSLGRKCVQCGTKKLLQIHHRDHKGLNVCKASRNNRLRNLVLLCRSCHGSLHGSVDAWARNWKKCRGCGTTEKPHHAHGYCSMCLYRYHPKYRTTK